MNGHRGGKPRSESKDDLETPPSAAGGIVPSLGTSMAPCHADLEGPSPPSPSRERVSQAYPTVGKNASALACIIFSNPARRSLITPYMYFFHLLDTSHSGGNGYRLFGHACGKGESFPALARILYVGVMRIAV
jgi:hypothetical protein